MGGEAIMIQGVDAAQDRKAAFQQFLAEDGPALLGFARRLLWNADDARDLVQDALVQAFQALPSFRGDSSLKHWVLRILVHEGIKKLRRRRLRARVLGLIGRGAGAPAGLGLQGASSPEQDACAREVRACLGRALDLLSSKQRAVVLLRHVEGLSIEEIADLFSTGPGTVRTHLVRGLRRLRSADLSGRGGVA
jgi:RNA polymerase sigma-70 factor (ECF subfamily)